MNGIPAVIIVIRPILLQAGPWKVDKQLCTKIKLFIKSFEVRSNVIRLNLEKIFDSVVYGHHSR